MDFHHWEKSCLHTWKIMIAWSLSNEYPHFWGLYRHSDIIMLSRYVNHTSQINLLIFSHESKVDKQKLRQ